MHQKKLIFSAVLRGDATSILCLPLHSMQLPTKAKRRHSRVSTKVSLVLCPRMAPVITDKRVKHLDTFVVIMRIAT